MCVCVCVCARVTMTVPTKGIVALKLAELNLYSKCLK